nr:MAG TPA: hypothetical protein [Bacteriophage sp.]
MSRAKRKSDEIYNERRRAKRLAARIEKATYATAREQRAAMSYAANLRAQAERTYVTKGATMEGAQKAAKALGVQTRRGVATDSQRRNEIFAREIRLASAGEQNTLGRDSLAKVKIFYTATQDAWEGQPLEMRNKAILAALGTDSLQEAFTEVLWQNRAALRAAKHASEPIEVTDENAWFYEDALDAEDYGSPDYLDYIVQATR